jgi:hypothetical protein
MTRMIATSLSEQMTVGSSMMSVTLSLEAAARPRRAVDAEVGDGRRVRGRDGLGERSVLTEVIADVRDLVEHDHGGRVGEDGSKS